MDIQNILKQLCDSEIESGCYDIKIDGTAIYNYIRSDIRYTYCGQLGLSTNEVVMKQSRYKRLKTDLISCFQIICLLLRKKKYNTFIYSFNRVDKVNDIYIDKFTDPLIDFSNLKNSYIIFEKGRNGLHFTPRIHKDHVVYTDTIRWISRFYTNYSYKKFNEKYHSELDELFNRIKIAFPNLIIDENYWRRTILWKITEGKMYQMIWKTIGVKSIFAPNRYDFSFMIPFAHKIGIPVYELQHGISIAESHLYSGFMDKEFIPDLFLAFGEMSITERYGINLDKIKIIGWAFDNYLSSINKGNKKINDSDVLLISESTVTDKMIATCNELAIACPNISFYYRPHPNELLSEEQKSRLTQHKNVHIDDNSQNILVTLNHFQHVIGENSTVLYEALSYGKKVGKLFMNGLLPIDLDENDYEYFWKIEDENTFKEFIEASPDSKKQRKIYSKFDKELFEDLINSYNQ